MNHSRVGWRSSSRGTPDLPQWARTSRRYQSETLMNLKLPLVKIPVNHCLLFASLPEERPEQLEASGNPVPHTCTCFEASFNDRKGLTLIGKNRGVGKPRPFLFVKILNAVDSEYNSPALSSYYCTSFFYTLDISTSF
jgi:hypothetical protein